MSKGHILVVEPNDITRKLIAGILNSKGYETYEAADGDTALGFLAKTPVLVILDVDRDNPSILGFLHKMQMEHSRLPMVAMSDAVDKDALKKRLGIVRMSVLEKPLVPESLLGDIQRHLMEGVEAGIEAFAPPPSPRRAPPGAADAQDPAVHKQREAHMRRAVDLAQEKMDADCGGPFGAVIVKNGRIIAEGWDATLSEHDPTVHAEMMAIRAAARALKDENLEGCEIYSSCEPCPMCLAAVYWAHIDRVFYASTREDAGAAGFDTDFIYRELSSPEHKRTLPAKMLLRDEAQIVLANWMKRK